MNRLPHSPDFDSMLIEAALIPSLLHLASIACHIGDNTDQINEQKKRLNASKQKATGASWMPLRWYL